ncbi:uncharacterized protein K444DRAFT_482861, partial [Hyaloscypha bicolor E]
FTALSYVWGDANDEIAISLNGHTLRLLRDEKRNLNVRADGVRINQQDEAEKGGQVQHMGTVYEIATHTVILLG